MVLNCAEWSMAGMERGHLLLLLQHLDESSRASAIKILLASSKEEVDHQVDEYVSLEEFAAREKPVITCEKPVGYVGDTTARPLHVEDRSVLPRIQVQPFAFDLIYVLLSEPPFAAACCCIN
jgi:hypothetical protein